MVFRPEDTVRLIHENIVETPNLEVQDIDDRSKASWITKSLALIQIIWFLTQLLARAIQKLPVTTLELFTLSIVSCAGFTYGFCWQKPFDVQRPIVLKSKAPRYRWPRDKKRMNFGQSARNSSSTVFFGISLTFISLFSGCHLIGWDFAFPSETEQWLWRAGSLCCLVIPIALILAQAYIDLEGLLKDCVFFYFGDLICSCAYCSLCGDVHESAIGAGWCVSNAQVDRLFPFVRHLRLGRPLGKLSKE